MKFRNKRTGQVQQVPKGGLLHRLMEKSAEFEEVAHEPRKRGGRPKGARKSTNSGGDSEASGAS